MFTGLLGKLSAESSRFKDFKYPWQVLACLAAGIFSSEYLAENFKLDDSQIKTKGLGETPDGAGQLEILVYPARSDKRAASSAKK